MARQETNNIRLGIFMLAALAILIFTLYMVGRDQSLFSSNIELRARFTNVNGLMSGNNVRYAGIQAGNVRRIDILNDSTIEVVLLINRKFEPFVKKNALVSIGSEGLMGNKVINISPNAVPAPMAEEGDLLLTRKGTDIDNMLQTLSGSNENVAVISEELKLTIRRLNNSTALWEILNDPSLSGNLREALVNVRMAAIRANAATGALEQMSQDVRRGKGIAGVLLSDTDAAGQMRNAIARMNHAAAAADLLASRLDSLAGSVHADIRDGAGPMHVLLKDTALVRRLNNSMTHIEHGTAAFNADMEALKHNFLLRGYFRRQERRNRP